MAKTKATQTGVPIEQIDEIRFFTHDDETDARGNNEPGGDVWVNAADLVRAVRAHEDKIFAVSSVAIGGGLHPILRESIKAANEVTIALLNRVILQATKTAKRGSN